MAEMARPISIHALKSEVWRECFDQVAVEEPVELRIAGEPLAVVMRTPGDDLALAAGFLLAEGIIRGADDLLSLRHCKSGADVGFENVVDAKLANAESAQALLAQRRAERSTVTSSSCGVCGKRSIESLHCLCPPFDQPPRLDIPLIRRLPDRLRSQQSVFETTGGLHAAAIFDTQGQLLVLKEDVGRHNAVDKCLGTLLLKELLPVDGILMVSGRTSFEIVQKALVGRVQVVAGVSAPSSLAVELARSSNMGLCGFVRDGNLNVYAGNP